MIRKIAYIGFGDLGRQVSLFLRQVFPGEISEIYFDDNLFSTQHQTHFLSQNIVISNLILMIFISVWDIKILN
jgi:hypothetical protein